MVGKKYKVLKKIVVLVFFVRYVAKRREKPVWKITTKNMNLKLLPSD